MQVWFGRYSQLKKNLTTRYLIHSRFDARNVRSLRDSDGPVCIFPHLVGGHGLLVH